MRSAFLITSGADAGGAGGGGGGGGGVGAGVDDSDDDGGVGEGVLDLMEEPDFCGFGGSGGLSDFVRSKSKLPADADVTRESNGIFSGCKLKSSFD